MRVGFEVFVVIVLCVGETLAWDRKNVGFKEQLSLKASLAPTNEAQKSKAYFYWESPLLTPGNNSNFPLSFKNSNKVPSTFNNEIFANNSSSSKKKRKNNRRKLKHNDIISNDLNNGKSSLGTKNKSSHKQTNSRKRHKGRKKGKKSRNKNRRKNKADGEGNVLEIPLKAKSITDFSSWDIKADASVQKLISQLNTNPGLAHEDLLGRGEGVKIRGHKLTSGPINVSSPSLPNPNDGGYNVSDYRTDTRILLAHRDGKVDKITSQGRSLNESQLYDPGAEMVTTVPAITQSIFKSDVKEDKISNKKETWTENTWRHYNGHSKDYVYPKINYSELLKTRDSNESGFVVKESNLGATNSGDLKTNQIINFLGKLSNSSGLEDGYKYGKVTCKFNNGGCAHFCNQLSAPHCSCLEGFELGVDGRSCFDIDECSKSNGECEGICYNIQGSYYCACPAGLRIGDNLKSCEDVNECLLRNGHGPCQDTCTNTFGSYYCGCSALNGTRLAQDKHACEDVNECKEGRSGCSHGCINTLGRAFCTCPNGMELGHDWKTCYDINECDDEEIRKGCKYGCLNTLGSYHCLELDAEQNDQIPVAPKHIVCPPLFPPKHGFFHCSRKKAALGFKTRDGRLRITNRPGTFCQLVCPEGYKNVGSFRVTCNVDGRWVGERAGKCSLILGRNYDIRYNYIDVSWAFSKPKIKCPGPVSVQLEPGQKIAYVKFPPPKISVDWKYVQSDPASAKTLEAYLPHGHHWITFKATDPYSKLTAKCIIYVVVKKTKMY